MQFLVFVASILFMTSAQASESKAHSHFLFVDFPEACMKNQKFPCTIRSAKTPLKFEIASVQYALDAQSSVKIVSTEEFQLLEGRLWTDAKEKTSFRLNKNINLHFQGEIFSEKNKDMTIRVRNLSAQIDFDSHYVFKQESLPTGFENWYGSLATDGQILRGVIRPIDKESFFAVWMPLAGHSAAELRKKAKGYLDLWADTVNQSADFYKEIAERRIASVKQAKYLQEQKQKSRRQEQDELRRIYREKNGL